MAFVKLVDSNSSKSNSLGRSYTLDDLEDNEEFQEVSERFLTSVGEKSNDVFEYLRDSDYNLFSGMQRAVESGKFSDEQKQDYKYLRKRFDNADMGSFKQYLSLTKDATIDILTDPTAMLAAVLTPVTGGTSLAIKSGISKGVIEGSKAIAKGQLKNVGKKQIAKTAAITGAEVGTWTGLDNHFRQNTEVNTGIRKLYSNTELVGSAALGVVTGGVLGGFVQRNALFNDRLSRLYSNDTYRKESKLKYNIKKGGAKLLAKTIGNASTIMKPFSKISKSAAELGESFSEEFAKNIGERSTKRIGFSYFEDLSNRRGNYLLDFDNIVAPLRKTGTLLPEDELSVIRILRGASPKGASKEVQKAAKELRIFFNKIDADAKAAGMETNTVANYFTRHWNREAIENDKVGFKNLLLSKGIVKKKDVDEVIDGMLNKQNELYSSHSNLISQSRVFKNMNDNDFEAFLTNDLVPVTTNYFMNASKTIEHKLHFLGAGKNVKVLKKYEVTEGTSDKERLVLFKQKNEDLFADRWIKKIEQEVKEGGQTLTGKDKKDILNTYKSITGQVNYFDSGLMQGIYDTTKLANAMAYLPLATVSSLSEAFLTLARAPVKSSVKGYQDGITKGHKIFTEELEQLLREKHKMSDDEIRREMNSVFIAVDEAMGDVTNRISGEGLQSPFLQKAARGFYRFNLLIPWTKTVQLSAFSTGKDLITDNLSKLYAIQQKE
jgi:histone H3/H4